MSFDFDDIEIEDMAAVGGLLGFAEEAGEDENRQPDPFDEPEDDPISVEDITDIDMRLLYNQDPEFFRNIVRTVRKQRKQWKILKEQKRVREESEQILEEIQEEIDSFKQENNGEK